MNIVAESVRIPIASPIPRNAHEFRCAAVVRAGLTGPKEAQPLWGEQWDRDSGGTKQIRFDPSKGFVLDIQPY